jgi:Icc-related predicted phosphoesterase
MSSIYFVSDLHLEFNISEKKLLESFPKADIIVLAGDVCTVYKDEGKKYLNFLKKCKELYKHVVFIAGNHEYYGCKYDRNGVIQILKNIASASDCIFLHRESKMIDNFLFIGATLWSRISDNAVYSISDFRNGVFRNKDEYIKEFIFDYNYLKEELEKKVEYTKVVITHHLPTIHLIHKRFLNSLVNTAFYTERLNTFNLDNVKYWVCGHTHEYAKMVKDKTTLIVNPIGYPGENRVTRISYEVYT